MKTNRTLNLLDLVLKGKWYDMIAHGNKRQEYREIKPYWTKRLTVENTTDKDGFIGNDFDFKDYTHVRFRRGYTKQSIVFKITDISVGRGNPDWGAPLDKDVYIISLAEKPLSIEMSNVVNDAIKSISAEMFEGKELTVDELVEDVSVAIRNAVGDDNLKFIPEGTLDKFNLVPADKYTKKILEKIQ